LILISQTKVIETHRSFGYCRILPIECFGSTRSQVRILSPRLAFQRLPILT